MDLSAESHLDGVLFALPEPYLSVGEPVVGELHLPAVDDPLAEDAEFIEDGESRDGIVHGRGRVHVAGGETSEAAVAEARVMLAFNYVVQIQVMFLQDLPGVFQQPAVEQVVVQRCSHEELHGEVVGLLAALLRYLFPEFLVESVDALAHGGRQDPVGLLWSHLIERASAQMHAYIFKYLFVVWIVHFSSPCEYL